MNLTLHEMTARACTESCFNRRQRKIPAAFKQIEVLGDITLILVKGAAGMMLLKGNPVDLDRIKTIVQNNTLVIDARNKKTLCNLIACVSALSIIPLIINGDAELSSGNTDCSDLEITLNGDARLKMDYEGKVTINAGI